MRLLPTRAMIAAKKKKKAFHIAVSLGAILAIGACGQDRNLTEYRSSQVELELNKYRSIQGTYRGLAFQKNANKPLGLIEVQLFANTVVDSDGLRHEARPVLQSYVTLRIPGLEEIVVSMNSGFFITQDGIFKTSINATRSGIARTLQLEGTMHGSSFDGVLSVFGYPNTALQIELTRNDEWPELTPTDYNKDRFPYISARNELRYDGTALYLAGKKAKASLKLINNAINSTDTLIDVLSPVRVFTGLIDVDNLLTRLTFSTMLWDAESKRLSGIAKLGGPDSIELRVECTEKLSQSTQGWSCTYTSSLGGTMSGFEFKRPLGLAETPRDLASH